jgi:hypothetical protein
MEIHCGAAVGGVMLKIGRGLWRTMRRRLQLRAVVTVMRPR